MATRQGYKFGVAWIANNDNPGSPDAGNWVEIATYISTMLLADLFGKTAKQVAQDVVVYRLHDAIQN